jgi:septal ring factor EnvC (AmiA/AmiB activator)
MNKLLVCLLSVALLWAPVGFAASPATQTDAQKLAQVESAIKDLNRQLSDIQVQRSELEKQLEKSEKNINDTMKHVEEIQAQIKAKEKEAGALSSGKKN